MKALVISDIHGSGYYGEKIKEINEKLEELEKSSGKKLGDKKNPLLVSVRSGARASMPGMMDTILNLGLNDKVTQHTIIASPQFYIGKYNNKETVSTWVFNIINDEVVENIDVEG